MGKKALAVSAALTAAAVGAGTAVYEKKIKHRSYSGVAGLPKSTASEILVPGCLVAEGGSLRGVYTAGVMDALMLHDINLQTTVGVSAGAMCGFNYVSGQIGRTARFNLSNRFNQRYVGLPAFLVNRSPFGFRYVFHGKTNVEPFDEARFDRPERRFVAVACNIETGQAEYFEKGKTPDIFRAIRASASLPIFSEAVRIGDQRYLDGGCAVNIAYQWALDEGFEKILVVRTRDRSFRKTAARSAGRAGLGEKLEAREYRRYPRLREALHGADARYDRECEELLRLEAEGRIFVIAPSVPPEISRLERDLEKLGALYWLGYHDAEASLPALRDYLAR